MHPGLVRQDGFIVAEEDLAAFTAKMVRLATDTELRTQMSEHARQDSELYAIERTTQVMLDLYQRVVEHTTGRRRSVRTRWIRFWDQWRK